MPSLHKHNTTQRRRPFMLAMYIFHHESSSEVPGQQPRQTTSPYPVSPASSLPPHLNGEGRHHIVNTRRQQVVIVDTDKWWREQAVDASACLPCLLLELPVQVSARCIANVPLLFHEASYIPYTVASPPCVQYVGR
ncbi:uncharacterized protein BKA78DRAFT_317530 [Phyllosticta capitalensis]|uniref:uncharacterized protein n=1 Tax=Phyllosticta capitalensis TaxID=121624 RepID=UPI003130DD5D